MKYLQKYNTVSEYNADEHFYPNVSWITTETDVRYAMSKDYSKDYLTLVILSSGTLTFTDADILASTDGGTTWATASTAPIAVNAGDKVLLKANGLQYTSYARFSSTAYFNVEGNIMSLISGDSFANVTVLESDQVLNHLFRATNVVSAENLILPATTLSERCYNEMFRGCTSLTTAPALPATTLAQGCYDTMFSYCTSLTTAPVLPATTLAQQSYAYMFNGCSSLTTAPELPAAELANRCYDRMFNGCSSLNTITCLATDISAYNCTNNWLNGVAASGTFTKASTMSDWETGASGIPDGWTVQDYSE